MGSTDIRCGALFGDDFGIALGTIGYYAANQVDYSVYGFGGAYQVGVAGGRNTIALPEPNTHIGLGIYGGVMGGWVRGLVYGTHLKGERYSLYVDGKTYTNEPVVELVPLADGNRKPVYSISTDQPEVIARGKAILQNGKQYISFNETFQQLAKADDIIVTVSPMGSSKGLYITEQDTKGFYVKENGEGNGTVSFSWIAIAARKGFDAVQHAPEILSKDFDEKMNNVMYNDNNLNGNPQYLWWDGKNIRFDKPPAKQEDKNYKPVGRLL